jgi:hypothetical protein
MSVFDTRLSGEALKAGIILPHQITIKKNYHEKQNGFYSKVACSNNGHYDGFLSKLVYKRSIYLRGIK